MSCRQCGDCCDPVTLRSTKRAIRSDLSLEGDEFILAHWRRISQADAFRRRPRLRALHTPGRYYYECRFFDPDTRQCTAHSFRPPICRAFPDNRRVEGRPLRLAALPQCGYTGTRAVEGPLVASQVVEETVGRRPSAR